ncbi:MAG: hypothetical protein ACLR3C_06090 [Eggerthella lenta]
MGQHGFLFAACEPGVARLEVAHLAIEEIEHFAQTADGLAERLHILQEEVVLRIVQQARHAAGGGARRRVQHGDARFERGAHMHVVGGVLEVGSRARRSRRRNA